MVNNWLVRGFMIIKGFNMNERHLWAAARFEHSAGFGRGRLHHIGRCLQPLPVWGKDDLSVVATLEYQCFMVNTLELGGGGDVLYSYQQQVDTGVGEGGDGKLHGGGRGVERGTGGGAAVPCPRRRRWAGPRIGRWGFGGWWAKA